MKETETGTKQVHFHMPEQEYEQLRKNAKRKGITVTNQARRYLGLGFTVEEIFHKGEEDIILRNRKTGRERGLPPF